MMDLIRHICYAIYLLAAQMLFVFKWKRKEHFIPKLLIWLAAYFAVIMLVPESVPAGGVLIPTNTLCILLALFTGVLACFEISPKGAVYAAVSASLLQHIASEVYALSVTCLLPGGRDISAAEMSVPYLYSWNMSLAVLFSYTITYAAAYFIFSKNMRDSSAVEIQPLSLTTIVGSAVILIHIIYDNAINIGLSGEPLFMAVDMLCCIVLLQLLHSLNRAEVDEKIFRRMLKDYQNHYSALTASIDTINRRSHDLKYQIEAIKNITTSEEQEKVIRQLQRDVSIYETMARTGNAPLDNTISERAFICESKKIRFDYFFDGKAIDFMDALDIYILFGNLLDNAIECVEKYPEEEKRIITLKGGIKNGILLIRIENYCDMEVPLQNGLPKTSKEDESSHGIGTKSALHVVEKYNGHIVYMQSKEMFYADIIFPPRGDANAPTPET